VHYKPVGRYAAPGGGYIVMFQDPTLCSISSIPLLSNGTLSVNTLSKHFPINTRNKTINLALETLKNFILTYFLSQGATGKSQKVILEDSKVKLKSCNVISSTV
jgi:hypothetical protein